MVYLEEIKTSMDKKWVSKFIFKGINYSIYKVKNGYNLIDEDSTKFMKIKKFDTLSDALESIDFKEEE